MSDDLHSEMYFGEQRDFWWNADFLELIARRWSLAEARTVLDLGSGLGHWARTVLPLLHESATIDGLDLEPVWVEQATAAAEAAGLADRVRFQLGDITERLPFPDDSFDLATCQTVLIHVADPRAVLRELLRVVRPGGRLLFAEPNNATSVLVRTNLQSQQPVEVQAEVAAFLLRCERGKRNLGEGDLSVGDLLPGMLAEVGATNVDVYLSDKAGPMWPPYAGREQQLFAAGPGESLASDTWWWSRADARHYFVAGEGDPRDFDGLWERRRAETEAAAAAAADGALHTAGGSLMYLVSGLVPC